MIIDSSLAKSIRRKMAEQFMSNVDLARKLNLHRTTVSKAIIGDCKVNKATYIKFVQWLTEDL